MNSTVFIAGNSPNSSPLAGSLVNHYLDAGKKVVTASFSETREVKESDEGGLLTAYTWVPGSSLSPRNILLQSHRDQGEAENAFLIYTVGKTGEPFHTASSASIQRLLDQKVKSYLFFWKELVGHYVSRRKGRLSVILHSEPGTLRDPLNAGTYGMFRSLVIASLQAYQKEPFRMGLFESESEDLEGFTSYILDLMVEETWEENMIYSFPEKAGRFSLGSKRRGVRP